jgi:hypothetical protein
MTTDLVYRRVLGTSPGFDWRKLREIAGLARWVRMCELATIVGRFAEQSALPLDTEGEVALLRWLIDYHGPEQDAPRVRAFMNLVEPAGSLGDHYEGYHAELRRCLDLDKQWRLGPWVVQALDRFCREALTAYQAAVTTVEVMDPAQLPLPLPGPQERVDRDEKPIVLSPGPPKGKTNSVEREREALVPLLRPERKEGESRRTTIERLLAAGKIERLPGSSIAVHYNLVTELARVWTRTDREDGIL